MDSVTLKNDDFFSKNNHNEFSILSSTISEINIGIHETIFSINISLKLLYPRGAKLKLRFLGVKEYCFYWNESHYFYNIESFKLL